MIIKEIRLLDEDISRKEDSSAPPAGAVVPAASESLPSSSSSTATPPPSSSAATPPSSPAVDELMASVVAAQSSRMHSHFTELLDDYTATKMPYFEGVAKSCSYLRAHLYSHTVFLFPLADSSAAEDTLSVFASGLKRLTKYTSLKELSALSYGDPDQACSIVSSMEFDNNCDFFAVAGVTKVIKVGIDLESRVRHCLCFVYRYMITIAYFVVLGSPTTSLS